MAVQGVLTLNTKAYNPRGVADSIGRWALVGDASFGGATSQATESVRGPSKDGIYRVRWTLSVPSAATADSACACTGQLLGTADVDIVARIPSSFTTAQRQDFVDRIQSLVASTPFDVSISGLEPSW